MLIKLYFMGYVVPHHWSDDKGSENYPGSRLLKMLHSPVKFKAEEGRCLPFLNPTFL
jgi:hypothetical protein